MVREKYAVQVGAALLDINVDPDRTANRGDAEMLTCLHGRHLGKALMASIPADGRCGILDTFLLSATDDESFSSKSHAQEVDSGGQLLSPADSLLAGALWGTLLDAADMSMAAAKGLPIPRSTAIDFVYYLARGPVRKLILSAAQPRWRDPTGDLPVRWFEKVGFQTQDLDHWMSAQKRRRIN